jgi:ribosomal-protein-alanine N-acetyltransferase
MQSNTLALTGERVLLRLARPSDVPSIVAYFRRNRRHLAPFEPIRPASFYRKAHWLKQVKTNLVEARDDRSLRLFLFERSRPDRVIGAVSFSNFVRGVFHACHLGYSLDAKMQGRGYMTEALMLAVAHVFGPLHMHRIMANYMPHNVRSARLLRRLGFRIEGRARSYLMIAGRWRDHVLTSLLNETWADGVK